MVSKNDLCNRLASYMKKSRGKEYSEAYKNDNEAFNNFNRLLTKNPTGVCDELVEEMHELISFSDLRREDKKELYEECSKLAFDMNIYCSYFNEKESNYDI